MNFISSEVLVNNVKNRLSTYFAQGTVDESHLYKAIKSCLDRIGFKAHQLKVVTLNIQDKQCDLPCDFFKVESIMGYEQVEYYDLNEREQGIMRISEREVVSIPVCKTKFDYCQDTCGNLIEIIQEFNLEKIKYTSLFPVHLDSKVGDSVTIQNGKIYANFSGNIILTYLSDNWDGEEFLVPDYTQITDWIETAMEVECLEFLYLNQVSDAIQRLQYLQNKLTEKQAIARSFYKMNEVKDFYNLRTLLNKRYSAYKNFIRPRNTHYL
jgi:hypothetical protein